MPLKRRRSNTFEDVIPISKRRDIQSFDHLSILSDEILIRILHHLPLETLLLCHTLSHHFYRLTSDSELWKSLYYDRFVLPRALRIPGMRAAQPTDALHFSSRKSKWLDDNTLVNRLDGKKTNWKSQYRLRHNWARGACEMQEIHLADRPSVPEMLVKLVEGVVVTADRDEGVRAWDLKEKTLIARCELGEGCVPTALAVEEGKELGIAIGFEDGAWGVWKLDVEKKEFKEVYRHAKSSMGMLSAVAYASPYVLTITDSQLLSLYTFKPTILDGEEETMDNSPHLLASLKSHTSWPPLSLSIRTTTSTLIASIAYSMPTYYSGYTIGLQELHLSLETGEITFSRLTSALAQGFSSILSSPPSSSSPGSGTTTPLNPPTQSRPTSLSYSHPYILATHPDNTLTLYLCTSTASTLTITPGTKLWGHTSSVSSAEITPRGKAVSVSTRGNELRVWELEGGLGTPSSRKKARIAGLGDRSVRVRTEDGSVHDGKDEEDRWRDAIQLEGRKSWVGFDDEVVIVLKEDGKGSQALVVYDFT